MNKHSVLVVKRDKNLQERLVDARLADGVQRSTPAEQALQYHRAAEAVWCVDLEKAQQAAFILVVCDGEVVAAARVLGAERAPERLLDAANRVHFAVLYTVPDFIEGLIGSKVRMTGRNPVAWTTLVETCGVVVSITGAGITFA